MLDPADPDPDLRPGSPGSVLSGRYRIASTLGCDDTAQVSLARDEVLERDVVVKVFHTLCTDDDPRAAARRRRELQSLARLNHRFLVRLLDGSIDPGGPAYLVLDRVPGPDLASRLGSGPLTEPEARLVGAQIADALHYTHGLGIVHHDVKPANILLGHDGPDGTLWARLSDFGTGPLVGAERADVPSGSASYLAPEQASGAEAGPAADIYALGIVLLEALTGDRCKPAASSEAGAARPSVPARLPAPWPELLDAMTATDPQHRPSAAEVAATLAAASAPLVGPAAGQAAEADAATEDEPAATAEPAASRNAPIGVLTRVVVGPPRSRRGAGSVLVLAALAFAALVSGGAVLLAGAASDGRVDQVPVTSGQRPSPATPSTHGPTHHPRATQVLAAPTAPQPPQVWHPARLTHSRAAHLVRRSALGPAVRRSSSRPTPSRTPTASPSPSPSASVSSSPSVQPSPTESTTDTPAPSGTPTPPGQSPPAGG